MTKRCKYCKKLIGLCNYPVHDDCKDAYEQGKLDLVELLGEQTMHTLGQEDISERIVAKRIYDWLKSQISKEGEKR